MNSSCPLTGASTFIYLSSTIQKLKTQAYNTSDAKILEKGDVIKLLLF